MGPYTYLVIRIDGDYALLQRTDLPDEEPLLVARALLPEETGEGTRLLWENLVYTILP
ncbi:MAG TPA: chorismate--pyruvate lyase [Candidatus Gallacutalibacter pullistercoris]|nr:chorismate--pyruvate lyase [Candidatus Gallacutalibacter pullistercoris]